MVDRLISGKHLTAGQRIASPNGRFALVMQTDGNLVLYGPSGEALWSSDTVGKVGARAEMQSDGNFVMYDSSGAAFWASNTSGHPGAFVVVQDDGNLVVYVGTSPLWSTDTYGGRKHEGGSWLSHAVSSVAHAVESAAHPIAVLANEAAKVAEIPAHIAQQALKVVTNNPVWDIVQTGVSFIPGVGTAVSVGMGIAAAVGRGASLKDIALAAARSALPGGPPVQAAFDVAVGLALHGTSQLTNEAMAQARAHVPGGALGQAAFDLALSIVLGKHVNVADVAVSAVRAAIPNDARAKALFEAGAGLGRGAGVVPPDVAARIQALMPADRVLRSAFQAGLLAAQAKNVKPQHLAKFRQTLPAGPKGKAMFDAVYGAHRAKLTQQHTIRARVAYLAAMRIVRNADLHDPKAKAFIDHTFARAKGRDKHAIAMVQILAIARRALAAQGRRTAHATHSGAAPWLLNRSAPESAGEQVFETYAWKPPARAHGNFLISW